MTILATFAMLTAPSAEASPWVKDAGGVYLKGSYSRFDAADFVQPDGQEVEDARFHGQTAGLYGEVGLGHNFQAVFNLPYVDSRNVIGSKTYGNRRFGDLEAGLQLGNLSADFPLSFSVLAKLPLYDNNRFEGEDDEALYPAMGDGQVDLSALLATGSGVKVGPVVGWFALESGLKHRTEIWLGDSSKPDRRHVDGLPFSAQLGWSPTVKDRQIGWLSASISGLKNLAHDESTREFVQVNGGGAVRIGRGFAVEAGYSRMVWVRNAARGGGLNLGISWSRDGGKGGTDEKK